MKLSNSDRYILKKMSDRIAADDPDFAERMAWPHGAGSLVGLEVSPRHAWWRACYRIVAPCAMLAAVIAAVTLATFGVAQASVGELAAAAALFLVAMAWMCLYLIRSHAARSRERL